LTCSLNAGNFKFISGFDSADLGFSINASQRNFNFNSYGTNIARGLYTRNLLYQEITGKSSRPDTRN
jgi:hypothetical protein